MATDGGTGVVRRDPLSREELTERQARQAARLAAALTDEPRDRSWAPGFESAIQDSVKIPSWRGNILADHEKALCRAERRHS